MNTSPTAFVIVALCIGVPIVGLIIFLSRGPKKTSAEPREMKFSNDDNTSAVLQATVMASLLNPPPVAAHPVSHATADSSPHAVPAPAPVIDMPAPDVHSHSGHIAPDQSCINSAGHHH